MKLTYVFLICCGVVESANILGIFPAPLYSHQSVFRPIWKELSLRGHNVTVITPNPLNENITNLKEIDLSFTYKLVFDVHNMQYHINTEKNVFKLMKLAFFAMRNITEESMKLYDIQSLLRSNKHFDLLLVEIHIPAWFAFAKVFNCPIIGISSMEAPNVFQKDQGNFFHPILNSHQNLQFSEDLTLSQRLMSYMFNLFDEYHTDKIVLPDQQRIARKYLNDNTIDLLEIRRNISMVFQNYLPGFNKVRTNVPTIIDINGLHIKEPKELPKDIKNYLDTAKNGAIYFSLGSSVKSHLINPEKTTELLDTFKELPYKVIWKYEEYIGVLPNNVKVVKWAPQADILRHPNIKLFITQGGIQSIEESLRSAVPMIGIPFFGDQFYNVERIQYLGFGVHIKFDNLNKEELKEYIVHIINNQTYKTNVLRAADILNNQPVKPMEKVVWWTDHVIRHNGAAYLRSPLPNCPWYQYYLIDVILIISVLFIMVALIVCKAIMLFRKLLEKYLFIKTKIE